MSLWTRTFPTTHSNPIHLFCCLCTLLTFYILFKKKMLSWKFAQNIISNIPFHVIILYKLFIHWINRKCAVLWYVSLSEYEPVTCMGMWDFGHIAQPYNDMLVTPLYSCPPCDPSISYHHHHHTVPAQQRRCLAIVTLGNHGGGRLCPSLSPPWISCLFLFLAISSASFSSHPTPSFHPLLVDTRRTFSPTHAYLKLQTSECSS